MSSLLKTSCTNFKVGPLVAIATSATILILTTAIQWQADPQTSFSTRLPSTSSLAQPSIALHRSQRQPLGTPQTPVVHQLMQLHDDKTSFVSMVYNSSHMAASWPVVGFMIGLVLGSLATWLLQQRQSTTGSPLSFISMAATSGGVRRQVGWKGKYSTYQSVLEEVTVMTYPEVEAALKEGYVLLDIRPNYERERIYPVDSLSVQFVMENQTSAFDLLSLGRKWAATTYAGSTRDMIRNPNFIEEVAKIFPKDAKVIVACGDGLRSLVAVKQLQDRGAFTSLAWLQDGLQMLEKEPWFRSAGTDVEVGYAEAGLDAGRIGAQFLRLISGQKK